MTDSLDFLDAVAGLPEQLAAAHDAAGAFAFRGEPSGGRRDPQHRRARDGRIGHRRRRARRRDQRNAAGPGHGAEAVPHARVRRAAHARVRAVVLGRNRGDAVDGRRRAGCRRARRRHLERGCAGRAGDEPRRTPRALPSRVHATRRAGRPRGPAVRRAVPHGDVARRARAARRRAGPACPASRQVPRRRSRALPIPRASWPAGSTARSRSSTAAARSARSRRCAGRPTSTRTPRRRRSGTRTPSSTTTRSAGGVSTAT